VDLALSIAKRAEEQGIRVDVDDREESVSKKVRDAEVEWIPFIVVVGEKEVASGKLAVRVRGGGLVEVAQDGLATLVGDQIHGKPRVPSYTPMLLSMKPRFG
jgi:threonyl-tRNA synthetase